MTYDTIPAELHNDYTKWVYSKHWIKIYLVSKLIISFVVIEILYHEFTEYWIGGHDWSLGGPKVATCIRS